ncbi:hypothetical protein ACFV27_21285 [Streptomyces antimycoticus]|uniref:hypothetical protein n=1 Tax=Streptomyces antimycoticus TaxID=68175 RepID=UPI0025709198|nr:hypothetical protein [Streptomyces antimycoticus]WJD94718.1 hypothetical protein QR300_01045 [Streptomyces antimycoticus]
MTMAAYPELIRTEHLDEAHGPRITLPAESTEPVYMAVSFDRITESGVAGRRPGGEPGEGRADALRLCVGAGGHHRAGSVG